MGLRNGTLYTTNSTKRTVTPNATITGINTTHTASHDAPNRARGEAVDVVPANGSGRRTAAKAVACTGTGTGTGTDTGIATRDKGTGASGSAAAPLRVPPGGAPLELQGTGGGAAASADIVLRLRR